MAAAPGDAPRMPLPQNPFNQSQCLDAYDSCLQSQNEAGNDEVRLMYARCLGHLLREAPDGAQNILADEIIECVSQGIDIDELAQFYINHLFRLFRQNKCNTPAPSEHPSRPSFEMHSPFFSVAAEPVPKSHAMAKQSALRRDGHRCMVTHAVDFATYRSMTVAQRQEYGLTAYNPFTMTNFCHIFPPSTNWNLNPEENGHPKVFSPLPTFLVRNADPNLQTKCSGNLWGIVNYFGGIDVLAELNGPNAHRLSNGLTMSTELLQLFDELLLWFEAVPDAFNTYTVRTAFRVFTLMNLPNPLVVTFTTTAANLELPDPKYLELHAAVCRVAHMSGAAGYLDLCDREVEEKKVMAYDGSLADLLASRLSRVVLVA